MRKEIVFVDPEESDFDDLFALMRSVIDFNLKTNARTGVLAQCLLVNSGHMKIEAVWLPSLVADKVANLLNEHRSEIMDFDPEAAEVQP